jgi:hypothetical protein
MMPYPCIGYCMIDSRGYCVGCGRPPTLGMPEACALNAADSREPPPRGSPAPRDPPAAKTGK